MDSSNRPEVKAAVRRAVMRGGEYIPPAEVTPEEWHDFVLLWLHDLGPHMEYVTMKPEAIKKHLWERPGAGSYQFRNVAQRVYDDSFLQSEMLSTRAILLVEHHFREAKKYRSFWMLQSGNLLMLEFEYTTDVDNQAGFDHNRTAVTEIVTKINFEVVSDDRLLELIYEDAERDKNPNLGSSHPGFCLVNSVTKAVGSTGQSRVARGGEMVAKAVAVTAALERLDPTGIMTRLD
ncbi:hypothetical protein HYX70_01270 [Candidatus Saccharibacteria bacterium]|nr:hypothetical protein [Candidatus Saccharibacteria bacterium]